MAVATVKKQTGNSHSHVVQWFDFRFVGKARQGAPQRHINGTNRGGRLNRDKVQLHIAQASIKAQAEA